MKDIVITAARLKKELVTLLICILAGFLANVGAIMYYKSDFKELFTSMPYVLVFALLMYGLWGGARIIIYTVKSFLQKNTR